VTTGARRVVLIAPNVSRRRGGEAIKAWQYFDHLLGTGADAFLITHARSADEVLAAFPADRVRIVPDSAFQRALWRSRLFAFLLDAVFFAGAARLARGFDPAGTVLHYICPISPVTPRLPPRGFRVVIGPLNGNIHHPPGLAARAGLRARLLRRVYRPVQIALRLTLAPWRGADVILVSGGARTRAALAWAGADPARMHDVADAGVADLAPAGSPPDPGRFAASGRMVAYKGFDLALRALAQCPATVMLDLYGDGPERARLEALAADLGLGGRAVFHGWTDQAALIERLRGSAGYVFPSLAEANGIVMQEAMMLGLPVIALRWGGPAALADDASAVFVEPGDDGATVAALARAMTALAADPARARAIGAAARARAQARFAWPAVAAGWSRHYAAGPAGKA
jgi:glycosyltransferase involved in cell wall biosynthesis